jgi:hypothetical protein
LIKQLQPNATGVTAEQGEVDSSAIFMRPQWQRKVPPDVSVFGDICRIFIEQSFLLAYDPI